MTKLCHLKVGFLNKCRSLNDFKFLYFVIQINKNRIINFIKYKHNFLFFELLLLSDTPYPSKNTFNFQTRQDNVGRKGKAFTVPELTP